MGQRSTEQVGFQDTSGVFVASRNSVKKVSRTSGTYGTTGQRVPTGWVGSMMSNAGRWLAEEKSFAITGVGILFSALFFTGIVVAGIVARYERKMDRVWVGNKNYEIVGVAEVPNEKGMYIPIYKDGAK